MKKFILILVVIVLLFTACSSNQGDGSGTETSVADSTEPQTNASASKTLDGEIRFYPTYDENYKTGHNEMFDFWFDIPVDWNAVDQTEDGSAYNILSGNDKVEIRIYGVLINEENKDADGFYASLAGSRGTVTEFIFRDGWVGTQIKVSDTEEYYLRVDGDSYLILHINAGKDPGWMAKNEEKLNYVALSARTTQESYGRYCEEENTITPEDLKLGSIIVGMSYDDLLKAIGQAPEDEVLEKYEGLTLRTLYFADETQVYVVGDTVYTVNITSSDYETPRGLKTGDSEDRLLELYGEPASKNDGIWGYNYNGYELFTAVVEDGIVTQLQIDYGTGETTIY
jgi:hypothetical protein